MEATQQRKSIPFTVTFDPDTYAEFERQMKVDFRTNKSEYLRFLVWKEENNRRNAKDRE